MEQSIFLQLVSRFFPGITLAIVETLNSTTNPLSYRHKQMLRMDFSPSGKWESVNTINSQVMADVVAMDSTLPLKKRNSIGKASGDIPKMGMQLWLNERQLTDLDTLIAQGGTQQQILAKLFEDTPKVVAGIYERNESMFLQGLSTGVTLVEDDENTGTGVRIDYGYPTANKFGVSVLWISASTAKPFDDIQRILDKANADGNTITRVMLDRTAFNAMANSTQAKELFAFSQNFQGGSTPAPSLTQMNTLVSDRYGFTFEIVDRSVRYEKNGTEVAKKPWADGAVVFLTSAQVGSLVYARLAEQNHPVPNVTYQTVENYILVSKYRKNEPVSEHTSSQARVLPVIMNVDRIYLLDSKTLQA